MEERRRTDQAMEDIQKEVQKINLTLAQFIVEQRFINQTVAEHNKTLYGSNGTPGLDKDVDRLKQIEDSRKSHFTYVWSIIVIIAGKLGWDILHGH